MLTGNLRTVFLPSCSPTRICFESCTALLKVSLFLLIRRFPSTHSKLEVKVINIKEGRNEPIVSRCKKLNEYSKFIQKAHEYWSETGNLEKAVESAIKYCRKHDILKEFLERYAKEILSMLYTEWNWDDALAVRYGEGHEDGFKDGQENEKISIARNLLTKGSTPEFVHEITGLSLEQIEKL